MKRFTKTDILAVALLLLAAFLRFDNLSLRPFHHDEGVNGFFLTKLVRDGAYKYDPANYHGPTLYYLSLPFVAAFGLSDFAVRGTVALFGLLTVALAWRFLSPLGAIFTLTTMALMTTSPGAVFFSRYFIHETLFLFFTLAIVAASPRRGAAEGWRFVATGFALGLLFATKETAFVSVGAIVAGALVAAWVVEGLSPIGVARGIVPYCRAQADGLINGALAFVVTGGLLYSSMFRNPQGVLDAFRTFAFWTKTAVRDHDNPWSQHLQWLWQADPSALVLGSLGVLTALVLRRSFLAVLTAVWTVLLVSAYSVIKYKTPWLGLNMLLPLSIMGGYFIHVLAGARLGGRVSLKGPAIALAVVASGYALNQSRVLETVTYDDEDHPYIYAHTQRAFLPFIRLIEDNARKIGPGRDASIAIFAKENWPMPWYLRDYPKAGYWGDFKDGVEADMFVCSVEQDAQMTAKLGDRYERIGPYQMRGVVNLVLWVRKPTPPAP